jgi:hypothetical protein
VPFAIIPLNKRKGTPIIVPVAGFAKTLKILTLLFM